MKDRNQHPDLRFTYWRLKSVPDRVFYRVAANKDDQLVEIVRIELVAGGTSQTGIQTDQSRLPGVWSCLEPYLTLVDRRDVYWELEKAGLQND